MAPFQYRNKTLKAVIDGLQTAKAIYAHDSERGIISILAINQRLRRLLQARLVTRKRGPGGHEYFYTATAKGRKLLK